MTTYRKVPLTKMSMTTLQSKRSDAKKKIQELKNELVSETKFEAEKLKVDKANLQIEKLNRELNFQRDRREVSTGLMGTIFGMKDMPESAINRIAVLRSEISIIDNSISRTLVENQTYIKSRIADTVEWLDKIISRIATLENKDTKQQSLKNRAAESNKTKRQIAKAVKKNLADNTDCPYCGCSLSTTVHADHIYPLAKGGESTKRNMVLVCAECNSKKSSLTLQAYIKKFNLDRDAIESRLETLGKDF